MADNPGLRPPLRGLRRTAAHIYHALGPAEGAFRDVLRALAFHAWRGLVRLGLARKAVLVMNCAGNREIDGFYAQFIVVLGLLAHFEKWRGEIAGIRVDFGDAGLYFDPSLGRNSWNYFFEAIEISRDTRAVEQALDARDQYRYFETGESLPRQRAAKLIARYIHVRPAILGKVGEFAHTRFRGFDVIGVHYRGTDKWTEAQRVAYEDVRAAVRSAVDAVGDGNFRLFVASDEQAFVDFMASSFPEKVISWETRRSTDGQPIDLRMEDNYRKGEDAVIDCLLLSRCTRLIRTRSSLGLSATFFNPDLPVVVLNESEKRRRKMREDIADGA